MCHIVRIELILLFSKLKDLWLLVILIQRQLYQSSRLWLQDMRIYKCVLTNHFNWNFILLVVLYMQNPLAERKAKLEASHQLQQIFREIEDEESWIREKEAAVASTNWGKY